MRKCFSHITIGLACCLLFSPFLAGAAAVNEEGEVLAQSGTGEFQLRQPGENFLQQFRDDPAFNYTYSREDYSWLGQLMWKIKRLFSVRIGSESAGEWLGVLLQLAAAALLIFVIYKLIRARYNGQGRRNRELWEKGNETGAGDVDHVSYPHLLRQALTAGNYALALRIHYWYILRLMDAREIIRWNACRPNPEYYYEIGDEQMRKDFRELTRIFDCVCYGGFGVDEALYGQLAGVFGEFQRKWKL